MPNDTHPPEPMRHVEFLDAPDDYGIVLMEQPG